MYCHKTLTACGGSTSTMLAHLKSNHISMLAAGAKSLDK
jgi:hypothetical protein